MKVIGASPPLVEILHFGIEYFIPKGDFRGIQNSEFIFMANNTIKGGHTPNKTIALTGKNFNL
jgi:hypothetical protein